MRISLVFVLIMIIQSCNFNSDSNYRESKELLFNRWVLISITIDDEPKYFYDKDNQTTCILDSKQRFVFEEISFSDTLIEVGRWSLYDNRKAIKFTDSLSNNETKYNILKLNKDLLVLGLQTKNKEIVKSTFASFDRLDEVMQDRSED